MGTRPRTHRRPKFGRPARRAKAGKAVGVLPIGTRSQRTLAAPAEVSGVGFVTGTATRVRFLPADPGTGIRFMRTDRPGRPVIPAHADAVTGTARRTTLGPAADGVTLVEHVLAALAGLRVDNCTVEIDGPEPPGLDGSSAAFVDALTEAGAVTQRAARPVMASTRPLTLTRDGATITLYPPEPDAGTELQITYVLDYGPASPIARQSHTMFHRPDAFAYGVAGCRTFLLEQEAHALREQGVGVHLTPAELLVYGPHGPIDNRVRFANEPARHKVLDVVGDLALCGFDLAGHVVAFRSGHSLNVALARAITTAAASAHGRPAVVRRAA